MRRFKELQDNLFSCLWLLLFWLLVSPPFHPKHLDSVKQEQHEHATIADQTTAARPIVAAYLTDPTINHRSDPLDYSESKETIWPTFTLWANKCLGRSPTVVSCGRTCKAGGSHSHSAGWEDTLQSHSTNSALHFASAQELVTVRCEALLPGHQQHHPFWQNSDSLWRCWVFHFPLCLMSTVTAKSHRKSSGISVFTARKS